MDIDIKSCFYRNDESKNSIEQFYNLAGAGLEPAASGL